MQGLTGKKKVQIQVCILKKNAFTHIPKCACAKVGWVLTGNLRTL